MDGIQGFDGVQNLDASFVKGVDSGFQTAQEKLQEVAKSRKGKNVVKQEHFEMLKTNRATSVSGTQNAVNARGDGMKAINENPEAQSVLGGSNAAEEMTSLKGAQNQDADGKGGNEPCIRKYGVGNEKNYD